MGRDQPTRITSTAAIGSHTVATSIAPSSGARKRQSSQLFPKTVALRALEEAKSRETP